MEKCRQTGFTLVEVLISVLVLALGVVGAAGMQLTALRTSQQSAFQTAALELAVEMADKMRANDRVMKQTGTANPFLQVDYKAIADPPAPSALCYSTTANCSAETLASFDIYEWEKRIQAVLPGGHAVICRDTTPWDSGNGALKWPCDGAGGNDASLVIKIGWQGKNPDGTLIRDSSKQAPPAVALTVAPYTK